MYWKVEIRTKKKFLAVGEAFMARLYSDLLQALKGDHLLTLGFQLAAALISASSVPHCWILAMRRSRSHPSDYSLLCPLSLSLFLFLPPSLIIIPYVMGRWTWAL